MTKKLYIKKDNETITLLDENEINKQNADLYDELSIKETYTTENLSDGVYFLTDKSNPPHMTLTVTSDKDIIQSGNNAVISANLKDGSSNVSGASIVFKAGSNTSTQTTNSSGNASYTYTGTGVGLRDIEVSYGKSVSGGNFLQETYAIGDYLKYDNATQSDHADSFWVSVTNITRNESDSIITSTSGNIFCHSNIGANTVIELDLKSTMGSASNVLYFTNNSGNTIKSFTLSNLGMTANTWKHLKITIVDSKVTVDGTSISEEDITGYTRLSPRVSADNTTYFKNLKVYSA